MMKKDPSKINKTILLMGETGTGKSTLINMMVNCIVGVEWEDKYRFEMVAQTRSQTESQTTAITVYEIFGEESDRIPFSLTIIDTPGFGDTRGIEQDELITKYLQELFTSPKGVDVIDAVCFVVKANQSRLTPTQQYIFDSVLSIFGKDIENNIVTLVTHADGGDPLVLEAFEKAKVPSLKDDSNKPVYFKFDNMISHQDDEEDDEDEEDEEDEKDEKDAEDKKIYSLSWEMSMKNLNMFFDALNEMEAKSLVLTQQVLEERKHLEINCFLIRKSLNETFQQIEELKKLETILKQHENDIEANKNFSILLVESGREKRAVDKKATNCIVCKGTCHHPCTESFGCKVFQNNKCTVCPKECSKADHCRENFIYVFKTEEHETTYKDLVINHFKMQVESMSAHLIFKLIYAKILALLTSGLRMILEMHETVQKLDRIALRPNPTSRLAYLDLQIEQAKKVNDIEKVKTLEEMREKEQKMTMTSINEEDSEEES
ncbi:uncharacterized protein LOC134041081 [Osmerus eperlanus]|uniref:uncharacterized protein LOC134041081 n=1 Tax=Osmerus eperlanus TaxID=29151 RepID=UPI002E13AF3B